MIAVGVVGYGTIGKRVADAVALQPDMTLVGVAKTTPNYEAEAALRKGYDLYAEPERAGAFEDAGVLVAGSLADLVAACDVVVDATPSGVGARNSELYERLGTPAIFQGGEDPEVADVSFNARANYDAAVGADYVRVVSCNTTGLARLLAPIREAFGIEKVRVTLVRRGGDPGQTDRGPINDIVPNPVGVPSHHGPDVGTVLPGVDVDTLALKVPATNMHVHSVNVTLAGDASAEEVREVLGRESRIFLIPGEASIDGAGTLRDFAGDLDRPRSDLWENCVWADSIGVRGPDLYLFQAIHQECDVVPENVDAVRAVAGTADRQTSMARTDETLGVGIESRLGRAPERLLQSAD